MLPFALEVCVPFAFFGVVYVFKWKDVWDDSEQNIYLSIRKLLNTEQGVLKVEESRLDNGNKQAGNTKPLEIVVVYKPC